MTDLITDKYKQRAGLVITLVVAVLAVAMEWQDMGKTFTLWAGRSFAILVVVSNVLGLKVAAPKVRAIGAGAIMILAVLLMSAGCGNLAAGYRAVTVTVKVGNETGRTLAGACSVQRKACVAKHKDAALRACLQPCHKALTAWTKIARPAINASTIATFGALETARAAKRTDSTWIAKIRPGLCALMGMLKEGKALLGDKAKPLLDLLATVEGVACSK